MPILVIERSQSPDSPFAVQPLSPSLCGLPTSNQPSTSSRRPPMSAEGDLSTQQSAATPAATVAVSDAAQSPLRKQVSALPSVEALDTGSSKQAYTACEETQTSKPSGLSLLRPGEGGFSYSGERTPGVGLADTESCTPTQKTAHLVQHPTFPRSQQQGKGSEGSNQPLENTGAADPSNAVECLTKCGTAGGESDAEDSGKGEMPSTALTTPTLAPSPAVRFQNLSDDDEAAVQHKDAISDSDTDSGVEDGLIATAADEFCKQPVFFRRNTESHLPLHHQPTERTPLLHWGSTRMDDLENPGEYGDVSHPAPSDTHGCKRSCISPSTEASHGAPPPGGGRGPHVDAGEGYVGALRHVYGRVRNIKDGMTKSLSMYTPREVGMAALHAIPAVMLGCLLNVLDGVSYGMIIFPAMGVFKGLGPMGISMFFMSTVVSQLAYTFGGSCFAGANGSMMIEVVPFFHIMANSIASRIGEDHPREIIATTLTAYALSSILTGLSFFLLGALKLGVIVGFFPRHILVGCIGGVGAFLFITGLTVSLRIADDAFTEAPWATLCYLFSDSHIAALWLLPLALAVLLRLITYRWRHQLIFPLYFIIIPSLFYIIVSAAGIDFGDLRRDGWLFDPDMDGTEEAWYKFYSYFDLNAIHFGPIWSTLPTQFALLFFNILHPPLNVPALSVSLNEDTDTNRELVGHGYSNLLAGICGTVPNYLVYVNTLLFYRVGGGTRIAGFMLALATAVLLFMGTGLIIYIPVMVVGALIFVLGIDLIKEALWDTRHRVTKTEYLTIFSIMVCMTVWDFVIGVLWGIIVSCFFFVVQSSQRRSIRSIQTGETTMSSVRRPSLQREYIREVSKQTTVIKMQGFLFFGTIAHVEETIRSLIDAPSWKHNPIRFLVLDLSLVANVDMSSAEAFVRIQRLLHDKGITLVFCGFEADSAVGKALSCVDVLGASGVELFSALNDAMEWTENEYLRAWYRHQKAERAALAYNIPKRKPSETEIYGSMGSLVRSPRHLHMRDAATRTLASAYSQPERDDFEAPFNTLIQVFSSFGDLCYSEFYPLKDYLERLCLPENHVLWKQGDSSDGLYIVESGVLRATYDFAGHAESIEESMFPGTLAGELSALSDLPRNATVTVESAAVLWRLSSDDLRRLRREEPGLATTFTHLVLKSAKIDYDILLGALAARQ
ncbi:hypothetical protein AX17_007480 [Amanita inopinata Kibby_2008]|nr:hypothetical protein AX17_007480 [Amanita inopinata Kibby_2008]